MDAITLRNFPESLKKVVVQKAKTEKLSLNKTILKILETALFISKKKKEYTDLDDLFGVMDENSYQNLSKSLRKQRSIDPKIWS